MRVLAMGDIHGYPRWKDVVKKHRKDVDKIIFCGDYFDSFDSKGPEQIENFKKILAFKKRNKNVILLMGNHDFHYLYNSATCSGFQINHYREIGEIIKKEVDKKNIQICSVIDNVIYSHAGFSKDWTSTYSIDLNDIENNVNDLLYKNPMSFYFRYGKNRSPYGNDICQGPLWIRPASLLDDKIDGFKQVVGHTSFKEILIKDNIAFIDTMDSGYYLISEDGNFISNKL